MPFEIFRPISPARRPLLNIRKDRRTCCFCSFEVSIEVVYVNEHTVDDPWHRRPDARLLANLPMAFRTTVVRCGSRQHDQSVTCLLLAVRQPAVRPCVT